MNLRKKPKRKRVKIIKGKDILKKGKNKNYLILFCLFFIVSSVLYPLEIRLGKEFLPNITKGKINNSIFLVFNKRLKSFNIESIVYNQKYNGVNILGGKLIEHRTPLGKTSYSGNIYYKIKPINKISISKERVEEIIKEKFKNYNILKNRLIILPLKKGDYYSYMIDILHNFKRYKIFIDAETGEILDKIDNTQYDEIPQIGKGIGILGDIKKLSTVLSNGAFWLRDRMRPALIETYDLRWTTDLKNAYFPSDDDNFWETRPVVDAHAYSGYVYDIYYTVFSREGIDNKNMKIKNYVDYGNKYDNAFWDGKEMVYGSGDESTYYPFSSALDVVAHEITHGVTEYTSNLIYQNESGALNEAFSDIMGVYTEFYYQPKGVGYLKSDWWIGEDLFMSFGNILRSIRAPYGESGYPSHYDMRYKGTADNGGVHRNSTIVSYVFYLLSEGGTNEYSGIYVSGIGIEKAIRIFYNAFTSYLPETANFHKARVETIRAAEDLYGKNTNEVEQVKRAWYSVGVE